MNFFAHAVVASWHSREPRFVLGAMLPDLIGMTGVRLNGTTDAVLKRGIDMHHATDAAFHAAPIFTALCADAIAHLTEQGVERGTSRAVAHVGVELTLDGALSAEQALHALYREALDVAGSGALDDTLSIVPAGGLARLTDGLRRLARASIPAAYAEPAVVADRLRIILASRPRLAMRPEDVEPVLRWATVVRPLVLERRHELLEQVRRAL